MDILNCVFRMAAPISNPGVTIHTNPNQPMPTNFQTPARIIPGVQVVGATQQHPPGPPILGHLDTLIKTINDSSQRDDLKLKALQVYNFIEVNIEN